MKPTFFKSQEEFRAWLEKNHGQVTELWVGLQKTGSSDKGLNYKQALDEALCFGWIDGVRKSIDESRYTIRFTPRKRGSVWSSVNNKRAEVLITQGLMRPAELKAYQARKENKSGIYSYEQRIVELPNPYDRLLQANE